MSPVAGRATGTVAAALLWAVGVAVLLLLPGGTLPSPPSWLPQALSEWGDGAVHGVLFFVQAWLVIPRTRIDAPAHRRVVIVSICLGYATLLEVAQIPVAGRSFQVLDIIFAALGVTCALALAARSKRTDPS